MPEQRLTAPYGSWASPITSDRIVQESISLLDILLDGEDVYWIEGRPQEGGRYVLVRRRPNGATTDVNSPPFNARTRVHEYGGGSAVVRNGVAYVSNFADQRLYRIVPGKAPVPLTPEPAGGDPNAGLRYADGQIDAERKLWVGVREDHRQAGVQNTLVAVDLDAGGPGTLLVQGNDFYSSPRLSPNGKRLAWLTWNLPNMPWVGNELWVADFTGDGVSNPVRVAGGPAESVFQPEWGPDGRLYFVSDRSGWWNLYRHEPNASATNLCPREAEFGQPQWTFGMTTYAFLSEGRLVCTYIEGGMGKLGLLDLGTGRLTPLELPFTEYGAVRAGGGRVLLRAGAPDTPTSVLSLEPDTGKTTLLRKATTVADDPEVRRHFTTPKPVKFPTSGGKSAYGLYYAPYNADYEGTADERPPLVVKCHGGPTSSASSTLDLRTQYWTSRGVAVIDVDYGGSTGYGREYRDRLHLQWGIVDVEDCAAAVRYLADEQLCDGTRAVITGGSAGGYTTLACLTYADAAVRKVFRAGGSHYGVSDPEALARDTHKFESRYLDWLIAPYEDPDPEAQARYRQVYQDRSPVHHADRLSAPVAFFQGTDDKVVPPNQTEVMVAALRGKGIPTQYLLFAGEEHGFRRAENIKRALDAELYFYAALAFGVGLRFGAPRAKK
ncbi:MAG TPA: prolyl oligopeptidase family serine peptidase [Gemmataceae bacterium]|jgi:dipeptidyl aminopeptidase/acylaminoacyl peptidase